MTPEEFKAKAKPRLRKKQYGELEWSDVTSVVGTANQGYKDRIVEAVQLEQSAEIGRVILFLIEEHVKANVDAELDSIIADGSLTLAEFSRIFN